MKRRKSGEILRLSNNLAIPLEDAVREQENTVRQLAETLDCARDQLATLKELLRSAQILNESATDLAFEICAPGLTGDTVFVPDTGDTSSPTLTVSGLEEFETPATASVLETLQPRD